MVKFLAVFFFLRIALAVVGLCAFVWILRFFFYFYEEWLWDFGEGHIESVVYLDSIAPFTASFSIHEQEHFPFSRVWFNFFSVLKFYCSGLSLPQVYFKVFIFGGVIMNGVVPLIFFSAYLLLVYGKPLILVHWFYVLPLCWKCLWDVRVSWYSLNIFDVEDPISYK